MGKFVPKSKNKITKKLLEKGCNGSRLINEPLGWSFLKKYGMSVAQKIFKFWFLMLSDMLFSLIFQFEDVKRSKKIFLVKKLDILKKTFWIILNKYEDYWQDRRKSYEVF